MRIALIIGLSLSCSTAIGHPLDPPRGISYAWDTTAHRDTLPVDTSRIMTARLSPLKSPVKQSIWGQGGFQFKLSGFLDLGGAWRRQHINNPYIQERDRTLTSFSLEPKIQLRADATLGTKLRLSLGYDTGATLSRDSKHIRLSYTGEGREFVQSLQMGQVSFSPENSLMGGVRHFAGLYGKFAIHPKLSLELALGPSHQKEPYRQTILGTKYTRRPFSILASDYDDNRHFFLARFFRERYDKVLGRLPHVEQKVKIKRLEVWVASRGRSLEEARTAVALPNLGEPTLSTLPGGVLPPEIEQIPHNRASNLYNNTVGVIRGKSPEELHGLLSGSMQAKRDYDILLSRRLKEEEYVLQEDLGYVSLVKKLAPEELLAVAYEYSYEGKIYRVGELASDYPDAGQEVLCLKLLKGIDNSPDTPYWQYMMRNVYALGGVAGGITGSRIELGIYRAGGEAGSEVAYVPQGKLQGRKLLELVGLDQLNQRREATPDGIADLLEGLTFNSKHGWVYLPRVEPFGKALIGLGLEEDMAYRELYYKTPTEARAISQKNKYSLRGYYDLMHTPQVGEPPPAYRSKGDFVGLNLVYKPSHEWRLSSSALFYRDALPSSKPEIGLEPIRNFTWGVSLSWRHESRWLTRMINQLPLLEATKVSLLSFGASWAELFPGYRKGRGYKGFSYLDDFDKSHSKLDLMSPHHWSLSSVPSSMLPRGTDVGPATAYRRAHLSWFTIDPILNREGMEGTPNYLKSNPYLMSSHYAREVGLEELYPERDRSHSRLNYIPTLNLRYYPRERGMYNLQTGGINSDGQLSAPQENWAGIQRAIDLPDFDSNNVTYLEFWLLDPFLEEKNHKGGDLYFNIGDVSEDILRDGRKFAEQNMPISEGYGGRETTQTEWGQIPRGMSMSRAFDGSPHARSRQDVGYDGLTSYDESQHPTYKSYVDQLRRVISPSLLSVWQNDKYSPLNDPAGDDFIHYLDPVWDAKEVSIVERYKYYNGVEGNSPEGGYIGRSGANSNKPDEEDINGDGMMNHRERYLSYKVSLRPEDMRVGLGHIVSSRTSEVSLRDGTSSKATWYLFRIPITDYHEAVGGASSKTSMNFMRMYLSGFHDVVDLRFASLSLVKGDWRVYDHVLNDGLGHVDPRSKLTVEAIGIEEHSDRKPINYIPPPDVERQRSDREGEMLQDDEQALSIKVERLAPDNSIAVYKELVQDLRHYTRLQLDVHAEQLFGRETATEDGELKLFIRLGQDLERNYYEYSAPLHLSPTGFYTADNLSHRELVWPRANRIDIDLKELPKLKMTRDKNFRDKLLSPKDVYSRPSASNKLHHVSLRGNPSLSDVRRIMIGIQNGSGAVRSAEIWVNELRLTTPKEQRSSSLEARASIELSDIASLRIEGRYATKGFGLVEQSYHERERKDRTSITFSGQIDMGRLLRKRMQATIPLNYNYRHEAYKPEYNPLNQDIGLDDALQSDLLDNSNKAHIKKLSLEGYSSKSFSITGMNIGVRSKRPMPYDPANFRLTYNYNLNESYSPDFIYRNNLNWFLGLTYDYSLPHAPLRPFAKLQGDTELARYLRSYALNILPSRINLESALSRRYEEQQLRNQIDGGDHGLLSATYAHLFSWQRKFNLSWKPLPSLSLTVSTGTDARIEAPDVQVNRSINPDQYVLWRQSVERSIATLGSPQGYRQQVVANYIMPFSIARMLRWISGSITYTGNYQWDRGAYLKNEQMQLPHTLSNQRQIDFTLQFNFRELYSRSTSLKDLEQRKSPLLFLKDLNLSYKELSSTHLPSYNQMIGNVFGQQVTLSGLAPGIPFALGLTDESYIGKAHARGWLTKEKDFASLPVYTQTNILDFRATLEPLRGLTISLLGNYNATKRSEHPYLSSEKNVRYGGDIQMTTVGLQGLFTEGIGLKGYNTPTFEAFLAKRREVQNELQGLLGATHSIELNSPAVLIPSFQRAYMLAGGSLSKITQSIRALLPNWTISYNLIHHLPRLKYFSRNFILRHAYRGIYRVNSYDTYNHWQEIEGTHLGITYTQPHAPTGARISLREDVTSISLSESFFPLIGADITLTNGLGFSLQWRKSRHLTLGLSLARLIETSSNEWSLGFNYHILNIAHLWEPLKARRAKNTQGKGLTLKVEYSHKRNTSLIRELGSGVTHATAGHIDQRFWLSLDYELTRMLTLKAYYERQRHAPEVSTISFPTVVHTYGISLRISLL